MSSVQNKYDDDDDDSSHLLTTCYMPDTVLIFTYINSFTPHELHIIILFKMKKMQLKELM